jgi:hypothetical protein
MTIDTYFSQDTDLRRLISKELREAKERVVVAVAWFTDQALFADLIKLHESGITVELIITNHEINDRSANDYSLLNSGRGYFASIGEDYSLMHMKFCVIDGSTVISGSANWTKAAFQTHHEQVTVTRGLTDYASSFMQEFARLRQITVTLSSSIPAGNTVLGAGTDVVDFTSVEYAYLIVKHGMLSLQLEAAVLQKNELERLFRLFDQLFARHLHPLLEKILDLKGRAYEKLKKRGYSNPEFEEYERAFRERSEAFASANKEPIRQLTPEETKELKRLYREAARKCHVDSPDCQYEADEANRIFSQLTDAYKDNDLEEVRVIHALVMAGSSFEKADPDNLRELRIAVNTLEQKLKDTWDVIKEMHSHEHFAVVCDETTWSTFFTHQRTVLQQEYETLKN